MIAVLRAARALRRLSHAAGCGHGKVTCPASTGCHVARAGWGRGRHDVAQVGPQSARPQTPRSK